MGNIKIGVFSKRDFIVLYRTTMPTFEKLIEPIKEEIGWQSGQKQKFSPKHVKRVIEFLGEP